LENQHKNSHRLFFARIRPLPWSGGMDPMAVGRGRPTWPFFTALPSKAIKKDARYSARHKEVHWAMEGFFYFFRKVAHSVSESQQALEPDTWMLSAWQAPSPL